MGSFGAGGVRSVAPVRSAPAPARPMPGNGLRVNARGAVNRSGNANRASQDAFGLNGANGFNGSAGVPLSFQDLLGLTPSNGFNYQFVNAINQDLPIKAFIDPVTQIEVAQAERLLRSTGGAFGGGSFIWGGGGGYYYPPESEEGAPPQAAEEQPPQNQNPQPQVIVLQQAPQQQSAESAGPASAPEEEPVRDEGEFTLVLRNGKQVDAVAFTRSNDKIVYITPGGGRLTIAMADLDTDATIRINQERGTPLQLPL